MPAPPETAQQERIGQCQDLVRSLASRIHRRLPSSVDLEDLIAYGQLGLVEAARDFDPGRGCQFSTYAYYRIRGAIYDGLAKMTWGSRAAYQTLRCERMSNEFLRQHGEEQAGQPEGGVESDAGWLRDVAGALAVVRLVSLETQENQSESPALRDSSQLPPPVVAIDHEISRRLHQLIDALAPQAATLIRAAYFEGLTLEEAGRRLGVSKSWASRLHARALHQLAQALGEFSAVETG